MASQNIASLNIPAPLSSGTQTISLRDLSGRDVSWTLVESGDVFAFYTRNWPNESKKLRCASHAEFHAEICDFITGICDKACVILTAEAHPTLKELVTALQMREMDGFCVELTLLPAEECQTCAFRKRIHKEPNPLRPDEVALAKMAKNYNVDILAIPCFTCGTKKTSIC